MRRIFLALALTAALVLTSCGGNAATGDTERVTDAEGLYDAALAERTGFEEKPADSDEERAIVLDHSLKGIKNVLDRASQGEELTIGFIGGSITEGYGVSDRSKCYVSLVSDWFRETFPEAEFTFVNAGLGGTGSDVALERLEEDLLDYGPDLVFVEFSVNDDTSFKAKNNFDKLLTRIGESDKEPAILVLNMVMYSNGYNTEETHNLVAFSHDIPALSMKQSLYADVEAGIYTSEDLADDGIHPNETGYALISGIITYFLEKTLCGAFPEEKYE